MSIRRINNKAQVILESVLVFISIVILAIGSLGIFAKLNLNYADRIDKYRQDRLNAVNDKPSISPENFLYSTVDNLGK